MALLEPVAGEKLEQRDAAQVELLGPVCVQGAFAGPSFSVLEVHVERAHVQAVLLGVLAHNQADGPQLAVQFSLLSLVKMT